jgi:hypothetical protein
VSRFRLIFMSLIALRLLGGDVAMLQVVAWTGMVVSRTAERGLTAAVESTFDGAEPCPLCKAVKAVKQSEQEQQPADPESLITKLKLKDMLRTDDLDIPCPLVEIPQVLSPAALLASLPATRCDAPAVPPPKPC